MHKPPSGRFVLRLPVKLHAALRRRASSSGLSLNQLCLRALTEYLSEGRTAEIASAPGPEARWLQAAHRVLGEEWLGAVLFGSEARGEARGDSDIDLLLVAGPAVPLTRRLYALWDEQPGDDRHSPHFVHLPASVTAAGSLWLEAAVDGTVLYDREGRVGRFLGRLRRAMAAGRLRRKTAYGQPYWVKAEGGPMHDE
jgi:predicted nucleotidyltransferase